MGPITKFNGWILGKVYRYLELAEGCYVTHRGYTDEGARIVVQDTFGFTYEISIRMIGRTIGDRPDIPAKSFIEKVG